MPANVYFSASALLSTLIQSTTNFTQTNWGVGGNFMIGKEWWVGGEWGLGVAGKFDTSIVFGNLADAVNLAGSIVFSATYN